MLANLDLTAARLPVGQLFGRGLAVEAERVAEIALEFVGNLEAADAMLLEGRAGEEVEDVFDVLDGVDVPVDVDIAVVGVDVTQMLGLAEAYAAVLGDGARLLVGCQHIA